MDYASESLKLHKQWKGKIEVVCRAPLETRDDLSLAYTPGVAEPCLEIQKDVEKSYDLTRRGNLVAVVTDGTAVLGLGDIGPEAGMPVMEGKCALFKAFGDVDAIPLCVRSKEVDEIVNTVRLLAGSFGGVNLEDISAPRCFEIERKLKECCDIPIFHDDQHGTAVVTLAAMLNALKLTGKIEEIRVVTSGAGAAGIAIIRLLIAMGLKNVILCDRQGSDLQGPRRIEQGKNRDGRDHQSGMPEGFAGRLPGRRGRVYRRIRPRLRDAGDGEVHEHESHSLPDGQSGAGNHAGSRQGSRRGGGWHRPQRFPEPDQQRARVPGYLPGALDVAPATSTMR